MVTRDGDALRLWQALNAERLGQGVVALTLDPTLSRVACRHATDLAARDTVDHLSSDGQGPFDRMRRADIRFGYAGENIALDLDVLHADRALWTLRRTGATRSNRTINASGSRRSQRTAANSSWKTLAISPVPLRYRWGEVPRLAFLPRA